MHRRGQKRQRATDDAGSASDSQNEDEVEEGEEKCQQPDPQSPGSPTGPQPPARTPGPQSPPPTDPPPLRWTLADRNAEIERERQEHIERLSKEETEKEREEEFVDPSPSYSPDPAYIGRGQPEGPEESVDPQSPPSPSYSPDPDYIGRGQPLNMPPVPEWRITNNDETTIDAHDHVTTTEPDIQRA